ncbi:Exonuclease [Novymonas esmeraldas]|uniref:Exonuclease n=1 Tax=Novymonas esmeraldas TaxID=1808958 RepID=A0AAW0EN98_9TRYP
MGRVRSLAKDLRQLERQKLAAATPPPPPTSVPANDTGACSAPGRVSDGVTSASSTVDVSALTAVAPAAPAAAMERADTPASPASASSDGAEAHRESEPPRPRSSPSAPRDAPLFSLGGSRFDVLMGGSHADGSACRKSQVRKATKACAGGGGSTTPSPPPPPPQPQQVDASDGDVSEAVVHPAPPLGEPSGIPTRAPYRRLLAQPFSHVLVCDFEATCASGSVHYPHEIIEFPVVVLDTATLRIVAQFHRYVRPLRNPTLTTFCTELTGITQAVVDGADPLPVVVAAFQTWLETEVYPLCTMWARHHGPDHLSRNLKSEQRRFVYDERTATARSNTAAEAMLCVATDGPWDMRRFMHECSVMRDGVDFPPLCYRYINVRHSYSDHFKCKQVKLTHMLRRMSMSFEGRRHSGIDDTRNIARVLAELFARGYRVHHVSTIKYAHRGDSFLESNQAAQELLSEYGEGDETHTRRFANASNGGAKQRGAKRA